MSRSVARATRSEMRHAPSRIEYSLWTWRWTNGVLFVEVFEARALIEEGQCTAHLGGYRLGPSAPAEPVSWSSRRPAPTTPRTGDRASLELAWLSPPSVSATTPFSAAPARDGRRPRTRAGPAHAGTIRGGEAGSRPGAEPGARARYG